jgi:hypothetical protein
MLTSVILSADNSENTRLTPEKCNNEMTICNLNSVARTEETGRQSKNFMVRGTKYLRIARIRRPKKFSENELLLKSTAKVCKKIMVWKCSLRSRYIDFNK